MVGPQHVFALFLGELSSHVSDPVLEVCLGPLALGVHHQHLLEPPLVDGPEMFDGVALRSPRWLEVQLEVFLEVGLGAVLDGAVRSVII